MVNLVRTFMVMKLGIRDFEVMDFCRRAVLLFNERPDLSAGLGPRFDLRDLTPKKRGRRFHGRMVKPPTRGVEDRCEMALF